jgi:hypothetical protein
VSFVEKENTKLKQRLAVQTQFLEANSIRISELEEALKRGAMEIPAPILVPEQVMQHDIGTHDPDDDDGDDDEEVQYHACQVDRFKAGA